MSLKKQPLQSFVELANGFVFRDSHVALQALDGCISSFGDGIRKLGLASPGRSLDQKWLAHSRSEIHHRKCYGIDDVSCGAQLGRKFACGREHVGCPLGVNTTPELICSHL